MRGRLLKTLMVILVLIPVGLTAYLAKSLYQRQGVPEALENLTRQIFKSKEDERKAEKRAEDLERKTAELQGAYDALVADLRGEMDSREVRVRRFRESLEINFVDKVLFASGSAEITPHGRDVLTKVAGVLVKIRDKSIYVVGHTDTMPIHSALFPSNWELSTARSAAVIRFLSESGGVPPERFTAMGRSFYQPVASNATPEGRQENRRVDIIVADVPIFGDIAQGNALEGPGAPAGSGAPAAGAGVPAGPGGPVERDLAPGDGTSPPASPGDRPGLRAPVDKTPAQPGPGEQSQSGPAPADQPRASQTPASQAPANGPAGSAAPEGRPSSVPPSSDQPPTPAAPTTPSAPAQGTTAPQGASPSSQPESRPELPPALPLPPSGS